MSYLALDFGEKRIGAAKSDELNFMAHALGVIERDKNATEFERIRVICQENQVQTIVVGLPRTMKGEIGTKAQETLSFCEELRQRLNYEVVTWDERLTTVEAERKLLSHDVSRAKRREKRDALAAEILLQSYLDYLKMKGEEKHE